jgi:hypothetical protein
MKDYKIKNRNKMVRYRRRLRREIDREKVEGREEVLNYIFVEANLIKFFIFYFCG